ncbi:MAG TPA: iron ABC transporter permease [Candidatus Krumholzibacteria bacterium]|nr:iron ABC transporter permease [Candidatus Krumholzibacteria bacterium]
MGFRLRLASERPLFWVLVLSLASAVVAILSLSTGAVQLPWRELWSTLVDREHPLHGLITDVRLPRLVAAALVGAALAASGALMQTAVRNALADPALLGVSAGAGIGALIAILFFPATPLLVPGFAFLGAFAGVGSVLAASMLGGMLGSPLRIILSGVALQAIFFSVISLLVFFFAERAPAFVAFTVGSLASAGWYEVQLALGPTLAGLVLAGLMVRWLDVLLLDDDSAWSVGLPVARVRLAVCAVAALLAASAVTIAGLVGFVGLVVPNAFRIVIGPHHGRLLPLAVLGGAFLMMTVDLSARTLVAPLELPVGSLLAFLGGPTLLYLLWKHLA